MGNVPHVMRVQGMMYYVLAMELLSCPSDLRRNSQVWFEMVVEALKVLFFSGLIHGDVKPEHVLEGDDGRCVLG